MVTTSLPKATGAIAGKLSEKPHCPLAELAWTSAPITP
jgi:hypothetical protein